MTAITGGPSYPRRGASSPTSRTPLAGAHEAGRSGQRRVSVMLPTFVVAGGGGVLIDADGNSLIDLGSGIAVTNVGNAARMSWPVSSSRSPRSPHLLHGHPVRVVRRRV